MWLQSYGAGSQKVAPGSGGRLTLELTLDQTDTLRPLWLSSSTLSSFRKPYSEVLLNWWCLPFFRRNSRRSVQLGGMPWEGASGLQFLCVFKSSGRLVCDITLTFYKALPFLISLLGMTLFEEF